MTFAVAREGHGAGVHGRRLAVAAVSAVPGEEIIHFIVAVVGVLADFTAGLQHHAGADRAGAEHLLRGEERIALKVAGAALEVLEALGRVGELADECHRDQPPVSFLLLFVAHGRENCNRFSRGGRQGSRLNIKNPRTWRGVIRLYGFSLAAGLPAAVREDQIVQVLDLIGTHNVITLLSFSVAFSLTEKMQDFKRWFSQFT